VTAAVLRSRQAAVGRPVALLCLLFGAEQALAEGAAARSASALPDGVLTLPAPGSEMVRIPRGPVVLGSTADEVLAAAASCASEPLAHRCSEQTFANELGRHSRVLPEFFIDRIEVSVAEYSRCVSLGRCAEPPYAEGSERLRRTELPVVLVTWEEARAYCRFRNARLPSEAEFERAARGNAGEIFPWGNLYHARAANHGRLAVMPNDESDGYAELAPVWAFAAGKSRHGVLNLAGNAAEWQDDIYRERYTDPEPDPNQTARRVVRGGSFLSAAAWLRGAARVGLPPSARRTDLGFRCARSAESGR